MLGEQLNSEESRGLLSAIDRMREILHGQKITLPEIVVVGDQSVGKSSVLEAISGIQLPRAQNICTRCPLELRMKTAQHKEYATIRSSIGDKKEKRIADLTKIADEVTRLTTEIAGAGTGVSDSPIYLTVYKHDIRHDLTLIDLPGITRNPLPGQADNIHDQILNLINKYIQPDTAIVLHVIPASVDFTTSESMKLAKAFDPSCERQLIAASKIDKFDKGIAEKLQGRGSGSMDLQLGCVAVLNRNQDEIDQNVSFDVMREREKQFFVKHNEAFQQLPNEFKGSEQLVRRLATIQQDRIRSTFPNIIRELRKQIVEKKAELKKIPASMSTEAECWMHFQSMVSAYREEIHANVKGEYEQTASIDLSVSPHKPTSAAMGPNRDVRLNDDGHEETENHIAYHIYEMQREFQMKCIRSYANFLTHEYHKIVVREINQTAGVSLPNFPNYQIIVGLFRKELEKLPACCHEVVEQIFDYMSKCLLRLFEKAFSNDYPRLKERLKEVIGKQLGEVKDIVWERVTEMLEMERRVFTLNRCYMDIVNKSKEEDKKKNEANDESSALAPVALAQQKMGSSLRKSLAESVSDFFASNEARAARDIQLALDAYAKVVEQRMSDGISQTCYHHFITLCALKMDGILSGSIPSSKLVQYMREPLKQTTLRDALKHSIAAYEEALQLGLAHL